MKKVSIPWFGFTLLCIFVLSCGFAVKAEAATNVYYSVGQNTNDHKTGTPTVTIVDGVATFSEPQTATNMGVGDKINFGGSTIFISGKQSTSVWNVITATGTIPVATTTATVTSITHAFSSLNEAVGDIPGAAGANYLNTADLTAGGGYILNVSCYYDSGSDPGGVRINGWTTGQNNYIRIYTATSTNTEANQSQRHAGVWSSTKYNVTSINATRPIIDIREDYVRVDGLQINRTMTSGSAAHAVVVGTLTIDNNRTEISNSIVVGTYSGGANGHGINTSNANNNTYIWNNIIYGFNGSASYGGIYSYGNTYAYNNTSYGNGRGISRDTGTLVAKNNIAYNNTTDYTGTFSILSTNNLSKDTTAPAFNTYYISKTLTFTNTTAGSEDFHLVIGDTDALNKGTNLSDDPDDFLDITIDIDGETRTGTWDLGADDYYVAPDTENPTITAFTIPATATSRNISISTFEADDNVAVTGYLITESATTPEVSNPNWSATPQTTYTITGTGTSHALHAWAMDGSENISAATIASIVITPTAASCSQADVNAQVSIAVAGDTIIIPAGNCTWSSAITVGKPITIIGAGSGAEGTELTASGAMSNGFFNITGFTASSLLRISGFSFMMTDHLQYGIYVHAMTGGVNMGEIRIDHNIFNNGYVQIEYEHGKGLVDNNSFINARKAIAFSSGSRTNANESWESPVAGTVNALFIEDNLFQTNSSYALDYTQEQIGTFNGGKLVVRYNEFDSDDIPITNSYSPFMAHGSADGGCGAPSIGYWQYDEESTQCRRRGQSVIEFYNNTMHGPRIDFPFISRSGANLVYSNAITGTVTNAPKIYFWEEEYAGDNWTIKRVGWPAEDQVHNSFVWNNTYHGIAYFNTSSHMILLPNADAGLLQDRDFFLHAPCGASDVTDAYGNTCTHGKAIFTGANGASNTYPTDGNTYPTLGTMSFTPNGDNAYVDYIPYTYPHPLRNETTYTISGTISGLSDTLILQKNSSDNETISSNGSFTFDTPLADGASYSVTVLTQPTGQTCIVSNGSGTISGSNVTNVAITCSNNSSEQPQVQTPSSGGGTSGHRSTITTSIPVETLKYSFQRNLSYGSEGTDVIQLQKFLASQGLLTSDNITGYFGPKTLSALQQFQKQNNIVSSGSPSTTGYGNFGALTRAKINSILSASAASSPAVAADNRKSLENLIASLQQQLLILLNQLYMQLRR